MSKLPTKREDRRTTISLAEVVYQTAEEMMEAKGYNGNFSAYLADLIRRDKEREAEKKLQASQATAKTSPSSPPEGTAQKAMEIIKRTSKRAPRPE
jgi:hypothetical protein